MTISPQPRRHPEHCCSAILETSDSDDQHHFKARTDASARKIASEWLARKVEERIAKRGSCTVLKYELQGLSERKPPTVTLSPVSNFGPEMTARALIKSAAFTLYASEPSGKESVWPSRVSPLSSGPPATTAS